ncbi:ATP-binding protein [Pseudidiomarina sp. E22-M8]|uniref:ATP-binding protein n=1 Tax=Pseudidiomarina sp. E22-M8 TaxID=3424768 RepID=UPI00403C6E6D
MESKFIDASPDPSSHISTLKRIGYTFNSAVSDIIDNSIAANCKNIWITATHVNAVVKIVIADDGFGMSSDELIQNMRIGCKDPSTKRAETDLGRFGSGMKTASFSQAEVLSVFSKVKGGEFTGASWDIEEVKRSNSWMLEVLGPQEVAGSTSEHRNLVSGTIVIWKNLHKYISVGDHQSADLEDILADEIFWLKKYISLHFHKFLVGRSRLNIYVNGEKLESLSPFMESEKGYWEGPSQSFKMRNRSGKVEIKVHNIPHTTRLREQAKERLETLNVLTNGQGFYVYRNKRLIIPGGWLGLARKSQLGRLARVEVNIPSSLDEDWITDVKKSSIEIPHQVKARLRSATQVPVKQSKKAHSYRGTAEKANDYWAIVENKATGQTSYQISSNNTELTDLVSELTYAQRSKLMSYLKELAINIPTHNIYYVMADDKKGIDQDTEELDRALREILFNE